MDVLKRSEFCGVSKVKKAVSGVVTLANIKQGTVFTGFVSTYPESFTWMRTNSGIVRLSDGGGMGSGYHTLAKNEALSWVVKGYKVLNATLVIDD